MVSLEPLKGMNDYYPELMSKVNYIFDKWKETCRKYGAEEYEAPIIESAELWLEKSGGELPEQMYTFKDKSDRQLALRPEMTPSLARMVAKKNKELKKPIKWFSMPRCYRYEQPQKARDREFFQLNYDVIGKYNPKVAAETIALYYDFLISLGLKDKDFVIRINSRKLLDSFLDSIEIKNKKEIMKEIDGIEKVPRAEFEKCLKEIGLKKEQIEKIYFLKTATLKDFKKLDAIGEKAKKDLEEMFDYLKLYSVKSAKFDPIIVRGLDYYTDVVFETFTTSGGRAIEGGGAYEDLISTFVKEKIPAIGFGSGVPGLILFLEEKKIFEKYKKNVEYYIAPLSEAAYEKAVKIAQEYRKKGTVELALEVQGLSKQFEYANYIGAKKIIILGDKDLENKQYTIKDLETGKESKEKL
ncbi:MAG: histidine--tRNA ligase [Candidatus ainarchaeum sp.]|nr:histidine--tRNA ligase [Candidatus ainarchaeum sp.]